MTDEDIAALRRGERAAPPHVAAPLPPDPPRAGPPEPPAPKPPWLAAGGALALALIAMTPHWVAISFAFLVAAIGAPIAWSMRRIHHGREQRFYVAITLVLALTVAIAAASAFVWMRLGVLRLPDITL